MINKGLVSIVMPSYNTGEYIKQTIESVLNQTYPNWELIIVDDCSTDNTDEVLKNYCDDRIIYVKNEKNLGAAESRNKALRLAKGRWIAFLDSDDLWLANKLDKQIDFMLENNYYFSATYYQTIDECSKDLAITVKAPRCISKTKMYMCNWIGCLTVMYDQERIGCIQIADIKKRNDYAMWIQVIKQTNCYVMGEVLSKYRMRSGSISDSKKLELIKSHYTMFHKADQQNKFNSLMLTIGNCFFTIYKKMHYVK